MSKPMDLTLEDPRSEDAQTLIAALSADIAHRYDHVDDGSGAFKPEDVINTRGGFLVGRVEKHPIACGAFRPVSHDIAEIKRMYVAPQYRGRGYSKLLLSRLEELAREASYTVVRLETGDRQDEAIRLYETSSYRRIPNYDIYEGHERNLCFEKQL